MNKCGLKLWRVSERIMKHVVDNTRWANLLPLFDGNTALVLAQRIEDIPAIVKEVNKTNFLELLGAFVMSNLMRSALLLQQSHATIAFCRRRRRRVSHDMQISKCMRPIPLACCKSHPSR